MIPTGIMVHSWDRGHVPENMLLVLLMGFAARIIHRRPEKNRWEEVLASVAGLPWKLSKGHDGDAEVFLDEPSSRAVILTDGLSPTTDYHRRAEYEDPQLLRVFWRC